MTDTPQEGQTPRSPGSSGGRPAQDRRDPATQDGPADRHDQSPAGQRSSREDLNRTPGDGTLQDATPAGLSAEELRRRAEDTDGSVQPGTG